ncbi:hypothetical protein AKJ45_02075 [candidate division MSBL1 archaeon SCGC-AAA261F19]|uniref:Uncharacterized protein n=1 Tax=candidate division MSBL1 archaeon SCGC-AAA261F19 TaxID=1698275 RepID=A0A133V9Z4_9EURY|nr:hypothetical protein AKJ45_02075 [candidate division MSBL1 archaeon SCGC-AAA261F19]
MALGERSLPSSLSLRSPNHGAAGREGCEREGDASAGVWIKRHNVFSGATVTLRSPNHIEREPRDEGDRGFSPPLSFTFPVVRHGMGLRVFHRIFSIWMVRIYRIYQAP